MKKIFTFMLMLAFALFAGVSCTNDPGTQSGKTAKVTVSGTPEANLPATGGEFTLNYAIENATLTGVLEVTTEAAWVHVGEVGAESVPFTYDANTDSPGSEPREAVISFAYTDADVVNVTVKQESDAPSFEVVWDETTLSCNYAAYSVKSEVDPEMLYLATTSADLTQYGVQGETVAEKMTNYVAILTQNYMIGTTTEGVWSGDGWFYFKGSMETPKELYRSTADDIYVYVVGFNITATDSYTWGTYATGIELTTAVHTYKAPFLPYPTITVSGDLAKTVSSEAGSVVLDVTVENPIEGNTGLVSVDENVTWATPTYDDGKVTIAYEANTVALPREAKVYIDYGKVNEYGWPETVAEQVVYTLTQEKDGAAAVVTFDIEVVETHFNGIIVNVTPSDLEVDYYLSTTSAKTFNYDTNTWDTIEVDWLEKINSEVKWGVDNTKCFKGALTNHRIVMTPGNYEWYGYDYHVYAFALNADKSGPASEASHVQTTVDVSDTPKLTLSGGGLVWNEEEGRYDLTVSKAGNYTFTYAVENPYEGASVRLNGSKLSDNYYSDLIGNDDQPIFDTANNTVTFVLNGYPEDWSKNFAPTCSNTLVYADDSDEYWGVQAQIKITWVEPTLTLVSSVADLTAGDYYVAGYATTYNDFDWTNYPYHFWTGAVSNLGNTTSNSDLLTVNGNEKMVLDPNMSSQDVEKGKPGVITLVAVEGKTNTYYVKSGDKYLYNAVSATNRRMQLGDTPTEWVASDHSAGGVVLASDGVQLGTAGATYNMIRSYKDASATSSLKYGLVFFK